MAPELWPAGVAAALLAAAAVVEGRALFGEPAGARWRRAAGRGLLAGAALALAVTVGWMTAARGWSPYDLRQVAVGLALAALLVDLPLGWRRAGGGERPAVALTALALVGMGAAVRPGGALLTAYRSAPWVLYILGGGAAIVAGCAGLMLGVRSVLAGRGRAVAGLRHAELHELARDATAVAATALGLGVLAGVDWAWQAAGSVSSGDPREAWLAAAWAAAVMGLWAGRLGERSGRWAAGLALVSAALAITGLLAVTDIRAILGL